MLNREGWQVGKDLVYKAVSGRRAGAAQEATKATEDGGPAGEAMHAATSQRRVES